MKFKNISDEDMTLWRVDFPVGEPVEVKDPNLAVKLSNMPQFEQVKPGRKPKNAKNQS